MSWSGVSGQGGEGGKHTVKGTAELYLPLHVDGHFLALSESSVQLNIYDANRAGDILIGNNGHQGSRLENEILWFSAEVHVCETILLLLILHSVMFFRCCHPCSLAPLLLTIESKSYYLYHIYGNHLPEKMQEFLATNQITITGSGCLRQGNKLDLFQGSVAVEELSGFRAFVVELIQFI